ncbi:MAG: polysaccharide biosynthesis C-terminal domain-containing protein [Lachnospiraceae bacterium]|nr:polysaccharide biosynthesis C-terminal domain-containing protein [Lachnospiraceae bacterium]
MLITAAYAMYTLRLIYTNLIFAAGKFKETQKYCIIECAINIIISFGLVRILGIVGVAVGTVVSSAYRMVASAYYLSKDIVFTPSKRFVKHIVVDLICVLISILLFSFFSFKVDNFGVWALLALFSMLISSAICCFVNAVAYEEFRSIIKSIIERCR